MSLCFCFVSPDTGSIILAQNDPLANLSLEQRVAQMFIVNLYGNQLTEAGRDFLIRWQPGGVVLLPENIATPNEVTQLTNSYRQAITDRGGVPLFITIDQEGGMISHLRDGFTVFPVPGIVNRYGRCRSG